MKNKFFSLFSQLRNYLMHLIKFIIDGFILEVKNVWWADQPWSVRFIQKGRNTTALKLLKKTFELHNILVLKKFSHAPSAAFNCSEGKKHVKT
jgi:hypothetical protein